MIKDEEHLLIQKVLAGEVRYFEPLVMKYQNMVFTLAHRIVKNQDDAEEVAQDTFLKAFQNLNSYQSKAKFSTWIYRICVNQAISKTRGKHFIQQQKSEELTENVNFEGIDNVLSQIEKKERESLIKKAINTLPSEASVLLTLFYFDELSVEEISDVLSITTSNVKVKLFRARKKFKEVLTNSFQDELKSMDLWKETNI